MMASGAHPPFSGAQAYPRSTRRRVLLTPGPPPAQWPRRQEDQRGPLLHGRHSGRGKAPALEEEQKGARCATSRLHLRALAHCCRLCVTAAALAQATASCLFSPRAIARQSLGCTPFSAVAAVALSSLFRPARTQCLGARRVHSKRRSGRTRTSSPTPTSRASPASPRKRRVSATRSQSRGAPTGPCPRVLTLPRLCRSLRRPALEGEEEDYRPLRAQGRDAPGLDAGRGGGPEPVAGPGLRHGHPLQLQDCHALRSSSV